VASKTVLKRKLEKAMGEIARRWGDMEETLKADWDSLIDALIVEGDHPHDVHWYTIFTWTTGPPHHFSHLHGRKFPSKAEAVAAIRDAAEGRRPT
jgi:hypothetical protein